MTDPLALDVAALERDRARYQALLAQAEEQITAWNERADHLMTAIDGLDRLLAFAPVDAGVDGGRPQKAAPARKTAAPAPVAAPAAPPPAPAVRSAPAPRPAPAKKAAAARKAPPSAPPPAEPSPTPPVLRRPDQSAPKGSEAIRAVLAAEPDRTFALPALLEELGRRGWLGDSKRPEEGIRLALKRLTDRGGVARAGEGLWRHADPSAVAPPAAPTEPDPESDPEPAVATGPPEHEAPPPAPEPEPEPAREPVAEVRPAFTTPVARPTPLGAPGLWRSGG